jgi:hypothetical protein
MELVEAYPYVCGVTAMTVSGLTLQGLALQGFALHRPVVWRDPCGLRPPGIEQVAQGRHRHGEAHAPDPDTGQDGLDRWRLASCPGMIQDASKRDGVVRCVHDDWEQERPRFQIESGQGQPHPERT